MRAELLADKLWEVIDLLFRRQSLRAANRDFQTGRVLRASYSCCVVASLGKCCRGNWDAAPV